MRNPLLFGLGLGALSLVGCALSHPSPDASVPDALVPDARRPQPGECGPGGLAIRYVTDWDERPAGLEAHNDAFYGDRRTHLSPGRYRYDLLRFTVEGERSTAASFTSERHIGTFMFEPDDIRLVLNSHREFGVQSIFAGPSPSWDRELSGIRTQAASEARGLVYLTQGTPELPCYGILDAEGNDVAPRTPIDVPNLSTSSRRLLIPRPGRVPLLFVWNELDELYSGVAGAPLRHRPGRAPGCLVRSATVLADPEDGSVAYVEECGDAAWLVREGAAPRELPFVPLDMGHGPNGSLTFVVGPRHETSISVRDADSLAELAHGRLPAVQAPSDMWQDAEPDVVGVSSGSVDATFAVQVRLEILDAVVERSALVRVCE